MVAHGDGALNVADGVLELEQDDAGECNICRCRKVERDEERELVFAAAQDPVFLIFSVRNFAVSDLLILLHLKECTADGCS